MSVAEIARATDLNRTTAGRFLSTLIELGYVERLEDGRHRLTSRILDLSTNYFSFMVLPTYALPHLEAFCESTGAAASLATLDRTDVVYTARVSERRVLSSAVHIGSRMPAHCTAIGKMLLSFLSADEIRGLYGSASELPARTNRTITSVDELIGAVAEIRRQGFSISEEEYELGGRAAAAPVLGPAGEPVCAVSVTSRTVDMARIDFLHDVVPAFLRTAHDINTAARSAVPESL